MAKLVGSIGGGWDIVRKLPISGAGTNIARGAFIELGVTEDTDRGVYIGSAANSALTDAMGILDEAHTAGATTDTDNEGTVYTLRNVASNVNGRYRCAYSFAAADDFDVASTSTTTVTLTIQDNMDGGYLYANSGTGAGRLALITTSNSTTDLTTKETTGWDSTTDVVLVLRVGSALIRIDASGNLTSASTAGSGVAIVYENWIKADGIPLQRLNPVLHSGLTGLNNRHLRLYSDVILLNHAYIG